MPNLSYQQQIINKSENAPWSLSLVTQASQSYQHEQHGCSPLLLSYDEIFNLEYLHIHAFISPLSLSASQLPLFTRGCVVFCHCTSQADLLFAAPNRDRWTFTGVWTKKQNLHCTLSGYQHGWVLSAGILSLELICRMSKMGKYWWWTGHSIQDPTVKGEKSLRSRGFQRQNTAEHGEIKAAGSLFIRRNECCRVPPLLSIHQDLCQHFPLVVFKLQHDNRKQEIKALAQFSDSNLIASGTKIGLMRMIFFFHYCDKASKTKQTQLLQSGPEYWSG